MKSKKEIKGKQWVLLKGLFKWGFSFGIIQLDFDNNYENILFFLSIGYGLTADNIKSKCFWFNLNFGRWNNKECEFNPRLSIKIS